MQLRRIKTYANNIKNKMDNKSIQSNNRRLCSKIPNRMYPAVICKT